MEDVCKFLHRRTEDLALFFYVKGQQKAIHTIDDASACRNFQKLTTCLFGDQDVEALRLRYVRMKQEFMDAQKTAPE